MAYTTCRGIGEGSAGSMISNVDQAHKRCCDNCERPVVTMHRFHRGKRYCSICYPREFKKVACGRCSGFARMHRRSVQEAVCGKCSRSDRLCIRCRRPVPRAGIRVGIDAVACPACAPNFREQEECGGCREMSSRLSWGSHGDLLVRLCPRCKNGLSHITCCYCRRYRINAGELADGRSYCSDCGPDGHAWHHCPGCGSLERGAGAGRCRTCLNRDAMQHDIRLLRVTLSSPWVGALLADFSRWLSDRDGANPSLPAIFRSHSNFFSALDARFNSPEGMTAGTMLELFSVAGLRKHLLPVQFLSEAGLVSIDPAVKQEHVESRRIDAIVAKAECAGRREDLFKLNEWLTREGKPTRTRRLYLSSASALLSDAEVPGISALDQAMIASYLSKVPGSRANLGATVRFARQILGHELCLPKQKPGSKAVSKPVAQLRPLLRKIRSSSVPPTLDLYERAISIAFRIPVSAISAGRWWPERAGGRLFVVSSKERVGCPAELADVLVGWLNVSRT